MCAVSVPARRGKSLVAIGPESAAEAPERYLFKKGPVTAIAATG